MVVLLGSLPEFKLKFEGIKTEDAAMTHFMKEECFKDVGLEKAKPLLPVS